MLNRPWMVILVLLSGCSYDFDQSDLDLKDAPLLIAEVFSGHRGLYDFVTYWPRGKGKPIQVMPYYNPQRQLSVATRRIDSKEVYHQTFTELTAVTDWDSHKGIAMGHDEEGGFHIVGNHHGSQMRYWRTRKPLTDPQQITDPENNFFAAGTMVDPTTHSGNSAGFNDPNTPEKECFHTGTESMVTYPLFRNILDGPHKGKLVLLYRQGCSQHGTTFVNRYETKTKTWVRHIPSLFNQWPNPRPYNVYFYIRDGNRLIDGIDHKVYHLVWSVNYGPGVVQGKALQRANIHYAYTRDFENYFNVKGERITIPVLPAIPWYEGWDTLHDSESLGYLPEGSSRVDGAWGFNVFWRTLAFDPEGNPVIAYSQDDEEGHTQGYVSRYDPSRGIWRSLKFTDWKGRFDDSTPGALDLNRNGVIIGTPVTRSEFFTHVAYIKATQNIDDPERSKNGVYKIDLINWKVLNPDQPLARAPRVVDPRCDKGSRLALLKLDDAETYGVRRESTDTETVSLRKQVLFHQSKGQESEYYYFLRREAFPPNYDRPWWHPTNLKHFQPKPSRMTLHRTQCDQSQQEEGLSTLSQSPRP